MSRAMSAYLNALGIIAVGASFIFGLLVNGYGLAIFAAIATGVCVLSGRRLASSALPSDRTRGPGDTSGPSVRATAIALTLASAFGAAMLLLSGFAVVAALFAGAGLLALVWWWLMSRSEPSHGASGPS